MMAAARKALRVIREVYANMERQPAGPTEPLVKEKRVDLMTVKVQLHRAWCQSPGVDHAISPGATDPTEQ
jgi:hypothetical protein